MSEQKPTDSESAQSAPPAAGPGRRGVRGFLAALPWQIKAAAAVLLVVGLGAVAYLAYQYYDSKKVISELVTLPEVPIVSVALAQQMPGYAQALNGAAEPLGVAANAAGDRIYVTESGGERTTVVFDRSGNRLAKLAPPDTAAGGRLPLYVAVDGGGRIYVSDRLRAVVDIYSPTGEYQGTFKPAGDPPRAPFALAFDKDGNFYVTDVAEGHHSLFVYDGSGSLKLSLGKPEVGPEGFAFPNGVAVDAKGNIYVSDSNNGRVQIFDKDGKYLYTIGRGGVGQLSIPRGVAVDNLSRLFIVDATGQTVEVWDVRAEPLRLYALGSLGVDSAQFYFPNGIALDQTGRVYVTDRVNNRVQAWSY